MKSAVLFLLIFSLQVSALPVGYVNCISENPMKVHRDLIKVSIVNEDNRQPRNIDPTEGRLFCLQRPPPKNTKIDKTFLMNAVFKKKTAGVANAFLAFQGDMAIVNRHNFVSQNGDKAATPTNCFFEHLASGDVIQVQAAEHKPHPNNGSSVAAAHQDFAVIRLKKAPAGGVFVKKEDIVIDSGSDMSKSVTVESNFADNNKSGNFEETTKTVCQRVDAYLLPSGDRSNLFASTCDTGLGSSGSRASFTDMGPSKVFGIVSGQHRVKPDGGDFDPYDLSTNIVSFDESLFESYEKLKARSAP